MKIKLFLLVTLLLSSFPVLAVDTSIAYQGVLRSSSGQTIQEKNQRIEFRLYTQVTGGEALWGRTFAVQLDDQGLFSLELSDSGGVIGGHCREEHLVDALRVARGASLFIGLTVQGSSGEISPRQKILMIPYASYAQDVDTAKGDFNVSHKLIAQTASITGPLAVEGSAGFSGDATFSKDVVVNANLTVGNSGAFHGYGIVPKGTVLMYGGSPASLPDGWAICDGKNGTPDLRDRFIVGAGGQYTPASTGGQNFVTLTEEQMPAHSHSTSVKTIGFCAAFQKYHEATAAPSLDENAGDQSYASDIRGGGKAHENRPPYYALYYIMRIL